MEAEPEEERTIDEDNKVIEEKATIGKSFVPMDDTPKFKLIGCVKRKVKKSWTCEDCGKVFKYLVHFYTHSRNVHNKNLSVNPKKIKKVKENGNCKICGRDFNSVAAMKKHIDQIHNKYGPFMCTTCDMEFPRLSRLRHHEPNCPLLIPAEVEPEASVSVSESVEGAGEVQLTC